MHKLFQPLDRKRVALLLTLLSNGGSNDLPLLDHLDDEHLDTIKEKAAVLQQIPGDKRAMFIAHELRKLLSEVSARGIDAIDPSWIIQAFESEEPRTVATILVGLPPHLLKNVIDKLPATLRKRLPPKDETKQIPANVVKAVRLRFEERFAPMPLAVDKTFSFRDIVVLEPKELASLLRNLGLEELAQAFVSVGRYALAELCKRLPREYAEELIATVKRQAAQDAMELKSAQRFLGRVLVNFTDTEELSRKAGLYRLSKALTLEEPDYLRAFYQRLPKTLGNLLESYILKVQEMQETDAERAKRLQDQILRNVQEMAKSGGISARYADLQYAFHG